jgi:amidophosphoribosyltransferase
MPERSADWMRQAKRDLESSRAQSRDGFHEWSCFIAQQAAEKAIKAVIQKQGGESRGHSLVSLLEGISDRLPSSDVPVKSARVLDRFYIPTRYPNGWAEGSPGDYFTEEDAEEAIACSDEILRFCDDLLA